MAWWNDFIGSIGDELKQFRLNDEEEKKRREQGGLKNTLVGFYDDALDTVQPFADRQLEAGKDAIGAGVGLVREAARVPAKLGLTLREGQDDSTNSKLLTDYQDLLKVPEADRLKEAEEQKTSRGIVLSKFKDKYGDISDASITKKIDELRANLEDPEKGVAKSDEPNRLVDPLAEGIQKIAKTINPNVDEDYGKRQILGSYEKEDGTVVPENTHSYASDARIGEEQTGNKATGMAYGGGLAALDLTPGGRAKTKFGEKAIREIVKLDSGVAIKDILKGKVADDVIERIAPILASSSDGKAIKSILDTAVVNPAKIDDAIRSVDNQGVYDVISSVDELVKAGDYTGARQLNRSLDEFAATNPNFKNVVNELDIRVDEAAGLTKNPAAQTDKFVQDYADMLKSYDDGARGGDLIPSADSPGGFVRSTEHTPFYRKIYAQNKRKPTKAEWLEEAKRQLDNGLADDATISEYKALQMDAEDAAKRVANGGQVADEAPTTIATEGTQRAQNVVDNATDPLQRAADDATQTQKAINERELAQGDEAMQSLDNATSAPKSVSDLSRMAKNSIENDSSGIKPNGVERAGGFVENATAPPVKYRVLDDGSIFIEDGSHRLEYARQNGIEDFPMEDVSHLYKQTEPPSGTGQVDDLVDAANPQPPVKDELVESLSKETDKVDAPPGSKGEATDKFLGNIKSGSEIEKKGQKKTRDKLYEQFFDKLNPIKKMVQGVEAQTGEKLATGENPYALMRLYAGMPGAVKQKVDQFVAALDGVKKVGADLDDVRSIGMARRVQGRPDTSFTMSLADANRVIDEAKQRLSPKQFAAVNKSIDDIATYNDSLLDMLVDAQVLNKEAADLIKNQNPDYFARMQVVNKLMEKGDTAFRNGRTFNLSKQQVVKTMKGMEEGTEILDPIESIVKQTELTMRTAHRNRVYTSMEKLAEIAPDVVKKIREPEKVVERISLGIKNKTMRPVRDKALRMAKTRKKKISKLETVINNLEKKGLNISLKTGKGSKAKMTDGDFLVQGLGGKAPTSKNADQLGPQDTARFVKSLIEGPAKDLVKIKKMVATREPKLASLMDEFIALNAEYKDAADSIKTNMMKMNELADADVPQGYKVISGFGRGTGGKLAVPEEIAEAYAGMNSKEMDFLNQAIGGLNRFMKTSVTSLSLPFAFIRNPIRDFKAMAANAESIRKRDIAKAWTKAFASAWKKDDLYKKWVESGGGGAGMYNEIGNPEDLVKNLTRDIKGAEINSPQDLLKAAGRALTWAPRKYVRAVQEAGAKLEAAPRLAEFDAALKKGLGDDAAALASRDVTVDFHQSGSVGQVMNHWIPFLNARLQGNKKLYDAAKRDPKRFATMYGALTVVPIATTAALNAQYPEVMEQIDQNTKDNNFVVILGNGQDEEGNFTQVLKIPKGDVDKVLGNPLENFVAFLRDEDPKGFGQTIAEMINAASPVDFVKDGKPNLSRLAGGVLPVAAKVPIEQATNQNLYFDSPIVPRSMEKLSNERQVRDSTPAVDKFLAGMVGASPLKVQQIRQGTSGSLFSANPADGLSSTLVGAGDKRPVNEFYDTYNKIDKARVEASAQINDALMKGDLKTAQAVAEEHNARIVQDLLPWFKRYGKYLDEDMTKKIDSLVINLSNNSIKQRANNLIQKAGL